MKKHLPFIFANLLVQAITITFGGKKDKQIAYRNQSRTGGVLGAVPSAAV